MEHENLYIIWRFEDLYGIVTFLLSFVEPDVADFIALEWTLHNIQYWGISDLRRVHTVAPLTEDDWFSRSSMFDPLKRLIRN